MSREGQANISRAGCTDGAIYSLNFYKLDPEPACDLDLEYCHMRHVVDCVRAHSGLQFAAVIQQS